MNHKSNNYIVMIDHTLTPSTTHGFVFINFKNICFFFGFEKKINLKMFVLKSKLNRSLNQFRLNPTTNLANLRWTTSTNQKTDAKKNATTEPKISKELEAQKEIFKEFSQLTGHTLEEKQDKFLGKLFQE